MTETLSEAKRALLAKRLRNRGARTIEPRPDGSAPPLSHAQERLWFLEEYAPGSTAYTVPLTVRLSGPLDEPALAAAMERLVARHEALRMRFPTTDDGRPELTFGDGYLLRSAEAADVDAAVELVAEELRTPFDLAAGPLLKALLVTIGPQDHVLLLAAHHIVVDGWSSDILLRDLLALLDGEEPEPLPIGFGDYAAWEAGRDYGRELDYWSDRLAGLPALDLPTDLPRPPVRGDAGRGVAVRIDAETVAGLARLDGTLYMTLLAAFQVLLGRLSGQDDFAVGTPVAGRGLPELDGVVGMFVNTLVMRADLAGDPTFAEYLARTRESALDAYAHQDVPFERLVSHLNLPRDVSRTPLTQAVFALQNYAGSADGRVTHLAAPAATSRTDLALYLFETGDGLTGSLTYSSELFTDASAHRLVERFAALLASVAADPGARLSELDLLAPGELQLIRSFERGPELTPLGIDLLHQVLKPSGVTALTCEGDELTYTELDTRATRLAAALR
ncbi:MAG: non-ribosomal peptide synthetase, partial [Nonomuraea sp.]|nr:non-ribosomal peptide synthetase [Nonomuraea sp.]